jgi:MoaA/NifB/PqqE/SkfB family radical SAM enzyme
VLLSFAIMAVERYVKKIASRTPGELLREAIKRARVALKLERRLGRGRALAPYAVSFWVTRRCNLNCEMCWVEHSRRLEGDEYLRARDELTLDELKAVVDDIARWRPRVGITGGEPFLRRDALEFIAYVKSRGLRCGVNTNGTFLARDAEALVETGLDGIMVSVDEFTFQHQWFTDRETADAQRALFAELFGRDTTYLQGFVAAEMPPVDVDALRRQVKAIKGKNWPFTVNFYPDLDERELEPFYESPRRNFRNECFSRWLRADVFPDGTVSPCLGLDVGNVRGKPFSEIWNGPAFRRFRAELAGRGLFPGCSRCCGLFSD